jgi:hypothetical protein
VLIVELLGFPSCYGVFQEYYSTSEEFAGSSNIAVVGACAMVYLPAGFLKVAGN